MKAIRACAAAGGALTLTAIFAATPPSSPTNQPRGGASLIDTEPKPDLLLLYTGDTIGYIDACG